MPHNECALDELLTRLEDVNAQAFESSDPSLHDAVDTIQVLEFIQERGRLLEQLCSMLALRAPVSYPVWNRLVVIHHQGDRILHNLTEVRSRVASELGANSSGRYFLDRVSSMLAPIPNRG